MVRKYYLLLKEEKFKQNRIFYGFTYKNPSAPLSNVLDNA